jgi:hypothetical protein
MHYHPPAPTRKRRNWLLPVLVLAPLLMVCLMMAAFGVFAYRQTLLPPLLVAGYSPDPSAVKPYSLSTEQEEFIIQNGYPDSFQILFYEDIQPDGKKINIRQETWGYHQQGFETTFKNGEVYTQRPADFSELAGLAPTAYRPEFFSRDIALDGILAVTGQSTYLIEELEPELLPEGELVVIKGLSFGFSAGRLRYLETIPVLAQ